jgi:two-component system, LytTR family, response regulator
MEPLAIPIRTLVVDDEPPARSRLRSLLDDDPDIQIVGECDDGAKAIGAIHRLKPALIFLDIEMPEGSGLDVLNSLPWHPVAIFVTAHRDYAVAAFEACAFDYLLKPFTRARFASVLARAKLELARGPRDGAINAQMPIRDLDRSAADLLIVRSGGRLVFVRCSELRWIEAERDYVRLHLRRGAHFVRETMASIQNRLDNSQFVRIHRSTIVNIREVSEVTPNIGKRLRRIAARWNGVEDEPPLSYRA